MRNCAQVSTVNVCGRGQGPGGGWQGEEAEDTRQET